jgi:protein phosphatase
VGLRYALASDIGQQRQNNEDCADAAPEIGVFVVADGMGGHVAGEVASRVAVEAAIKAVRDQPVPGRVRGELRVLANATIAANLAIVEEAERRNLQGMGTTLTLLRVRSSSAIIANVGDSRAYALTPRSMRALTRDQTVVALMLEGGMITKDEAMRHPEKHVLTQALGTRDKIEPQIVKTTFQRGTRLLLSTDGLHDVVPEHEIARIAAGEDLETAVGELIERANALGGPDNATALLVEP